MPLNSYAGRTALFYVAIFLVLGVALPYLPLWLENRGLTPVEIGIVTSLPLALRLIATPAIGLAADAPDALRRVVVISAATALAAACGLWAVSGFWLILLGVAVFQTGSTVLMPLADVIAMRGARRLNLDYGRMRLWGSVAFIAANVAAGWVIAASDTTAVMPMIAAASLFAVAAAITLPDGRDTAPASDSPARRPDLQTTLRLISQPSLLLIMLAAGTIQASHAVYYTFSAIHWEAQGISKEYFGILWGIGVVAEIWLFAYASGLVARVGAVAMIAFGGAAAALRWLAMAFDPPFAILAILQLMHGLSFGATHLGAVHAIQAHVGEQAAASAQTLHSAISAGVLMALATLISGAIYGPLQGGSYAVMALIALLGVALAAVIRIIPKGPAPAA